MALKADQIANRMESKEKPDDPFVITPKPDIDALQQSGAASVDLRLGCWFGVVRHSRISVFDCFSDPADVPTEASRMLLRYVPFGREFVLHPRNFILGGTLEWIRLSSDLTGYVTGKSSWGRYGLIIATATGVHPGFSGCLTLELTNVGEVPIAIRPGTAICQMFLHQVGGTSAHVDKSRFVGSRRPSLGSITLDDRAKKLGEGYS